jgi:hypothetical protein
VKTLKQRYFERRDERGGLGPNPWNAAEALAHDIHVSRLPDSKLEAEVRNGNQVWVTHGDEIPLRIDAVVVGNPGEICWLKDGSYVLSHDEALDRVLDVLEEHRAEVPSTSEAKTAAEHS